MPVKAIWLFADRVAIYRMAVFIITMVRSFRDEYSGFPLSTKEPRHAWQPRLKDMG